MERFPLIQLPRKSEESVRACSHTISWFPLIQLPRKSEEIPERTTEKINTGFH